MSNGAWLADLLNMRRKGMADAEVLQTLRENHKRGEYSGLCSRWARDNIKNYRMEREDE